MLCVPCADTFLVNGDLEQNHHGEVFDSRYGPDSVGGDPDISKAVAVINGVSVCVNHLMEAPRKEGGSPSLCSQCFRTYLSRTGSVVQEDGQVYREGSYPDKELAEIRSAVVTMSGNSLCASHATHYADQKG